ncbi:MAG: hybrid sensor histidine kinase/response regulator [Pseudomonadota bacterium]
MSHKINFYFILIMLLVTLCSVVFIFYMAKVERSKQIDMAVSKMKNIAAIESEDIIAQILFHSYSSLDLISKKILEENKNIFVDIRLNDFVTGNELKYKYCIPDNNGVCYNRDDDVLQFVYSLNYGGKDLGSLIMAQQMGSFTMLIKPSVSVIVLFASLVTIAMLGMFMFFIRKNISQPINICIRSFSEIKSGKRKNIPKMNTRDMNILVENINSLMEDLGIFQKIAERNTHLAAIGQISSHVAHDMRSPLSVIQGYLRGNQKNMKLLEAAKGSANKLNNMADELLDYAKASKIEPVATSLKSLVETTVSKEVKNIADEKGVKLIYDVRDDVVAKIDHYRMERVLTNLITNAVQAIDAESGEVKVSVKSDNENLKITVTDNGRGISKEDQKKIFDSFFTKGKMRGTGLGLSYCKNVIEAHGGAIAVESEVGRGTEFSINIPSCITTPHATCYIPHAVPSHQTSAVSGQPTKGELDSDNDILVVDDDVGIILIWCGLIEKKTGKPPITAKSPEEMMKAKIDYSRVSKAIVDYQYEGSKLTGLDVVQFLKEKGVQVIHMCTGMYHDEELQSQARKLGVASIIPKPISADTNI